MQSGALSLVQIHGDTVLSLVEPYYVSAWVYSMYLSLCCYTPCIYGIRELVSTTFESD